MTEEPADGTADGESSDPSPHIPADQDLDAHITAIHDHLVATEQLPLDPRANKWLGEAQALVADLDGADVSDETALRRLEKVQYLLEQVDDTGSDPANTQLDRVNARLSAVLD